MSTRKERFHAPDEISRRYFEEEKDVNSEDHDVLIRVHENVQNLTMLIQTSFADHESRLRSTEKDINYGKGAIKVLYAAATLLSVAVGALWWVKG